MGGQVSHSPNRPDRPAAAVAAASERTAATDYRDAPTRLHARDRARHAAAARGCLEGWWCARPMQVVVAIACVVVFLVGLWALWRAACTPGHASVAVHVAAALAWGMVSIAWFLLPRHVLFARVSIAMSVMALAIEALGLSALACFLSHTYGCRSNSTAAAGSQVKPVDSYSLATMY